MKTKKQKREEALKRMVNYAYSNSKAQRTGSAEIEQWLQANGREIENMQRILR